jgi:hypothetical protein
MTVRTSQAQWKGSLKQGQGTMKLGSGAFEGAYSFLALIAGILSSGSATQSAKVQLKTMLRLQEGLSPTS